MNPPAEPTSRPAAAPSPVFGLLVRARPRRGRQAISPSEVCTARTAPSASPRIASSLVLKCRLTPISTQESSTGFDDVGVGRHRQRPRARVDEVSLDAAVRTAPWSSRAPSGPASSTTAALDGVEDLVPLHRLADVLHVVDARRGRRPGRRARRSSTRSRRRACPRAAAGRPPSTVFAVVSMARHRGLVADVDALVDVHLLGAEEEPLEVGDLVAVHVGDAARAVGGVLVLGEDDDLGARIGTLGRARRADTRRARLRRRRSAVARDPSWADGSWRRALTMSDMDRPLC